MLRDRLVLGCKSTEARRKLLQTDPLTLKVVQDTLSVFEAVESAKNDVLQDSNHSPIHKVRRTPPVKFTKQSSPQYPSKCKNCGRTGCKGQKQCPAFGKNCHNCGKWNHFSKVCQTSNSRREHCHEVDNSAVLHVNVIPINAVSNIVVMKIDEKPVSMEVDTGASVTLISEKMWRDIGSPQLKPCDKIFSAYDGHKMKPLGNFIGTLSHEETTAQAKITVIQAFKLYGLLGRDYIPVFFSDSIQVNSVQEDPLPAMKVEPVSVDIADKTMLKFCRARPVPIPMKEKIHKELDRLEKNGIITPVSSSRYASPVVWVAKKDGSLRMCADFKVHVNNSIKSDSYPLPTIESIFAGLENSKKFAKLDLKEAYWQVPLDKAARTICMINTTKGLYQFNRLPKGMKNSSSIFQRVMEKILKDLDGILIYQDDILIHGKDSNELARRVSNVYERLHQKNVTINREKSQIDCDSIKFLGHLISADGVKPDPEIVKKITSCKPPTNKSEVESFIGLVNFFGRMIPNFAELTHPLNKLRRKDEKFVWETQHQDSFDKLLKALSSKPVLQSYSLEKEATLTTDASERCIGGVLTQQGRPVIFVSRNLSPAEQRYSNIEREALAIVWSCSRLRQLLIGRKFTLVTDHKPLLKIYGNGGLPKVVSSRLTRWAALLQPFEFEVQYHPGTSIPHADSVTRLKFNSDESISEDLVINDVEDSGMSDELRQQVASITSKEEIAQRIIRRISQNKWNNIRQDEKPFAILKKKLSLHSNIIWMDKKAYIPASIRRDSFMVAHQFHTGINSTINRLKFSCWWPGMRKDVDSWIRQCHVCNQCRPRTAKTNSSWPSSQPFERIHADWCHIPGTGNLLIIVDSASGWIESSLPMARTTGNIIDSLSTWCCRYGVPKLFVTDNAPEFTSEELNTWCSKNGISKRESPPYHPESNGNAERGVQTVKQFLRVWKESVCHMSLKDYIKRIMFHHRACFKRADGKTPGEIVFNRPMRVPMTKQFLFGESIKLIQRHGQVSDADFLMQRSQNTALVFDKLINGLKLAHQSQMAKATQDTSDNKNVELEPLATSTPIRTDNKSSEAIGDPDSTIPMKEEMKSPSRPQRKCQVKDYAKLAKGR